MFLISLGITYIGFWLSHLLEVNDFFIIIVNLIFIIELQIYVFIFSRLAKKTENSIYFEFTRAAFIIGTGLAYIYFIFPTIDRMLSFFIFIRVLQMGVLCYYAFWGINLNSFFWMAIVTIIGSTILSSIHHFIWHLHYHYLSVIGLYYASKIFMAEGLLKIDKN